MTGCNDVEPCGFADVVVEGRDAAEPGRDDGAGGSGAARRRTSIPASVRPKGAAISFPPPRASSVGAEIVAEAVAAGGEERPRGRRGTDAPHRPLRRRRG